MALGAGFGGAWVRRAPRAVSQELIDFHRNEQMVKLRAFLNGSLLALRPKIGSREE
jgi:hypothetical protein